MKSLRVVLFATVLASLSVWSTEQADAQEMIGAKQVIQRARQQQAGGHTESNDEAMLKTLRELTDQLEKLPPDQAAALWLKAIDSVPALRDQPHQGEAKPDGTALIGALPAPSVWPEISRQIDERELPGKDSARLRAIILRILGHRLNGQYDTLKHDLDEAMTIIDGKKKQSKGFFSRLFNPSFDNTDYVREQQKRQLRDIQNRFEPHSLVDSFRGELEEAEKQNGSYLTVPDLVRVVGRDAAAPLLEKALLLPNVNLSFSNLSRDDHGRDNATIILARELARQNLAKIPRRLWELCESFDTTDLFEAFANLQAPQSAELRFDSNDASTWYVLGLIVHDRGDEIEKFLTAIADEGGDVAGLASNINTTLTYYVLPRSSRIADVRKFHEFFAESLNDHPEFPFWDSYMSLAAALGKSRQALSLIETVLQRNELPDSDRPRLERVHADALLVADRVDEGIAAYSKLLVAAKDQRPISPVGVEQGQSNLALRIAQIGILMDRPEWIRKGTDSFDAAFEQVDASEDSSYVHESELDKIVQVLNELKQSAHAERLLTERLVRQVALFEKRDQRLGHYSGTHGIERTLKLLIETYHSADRWNDVVELLETAPWWNESDISEWLSRNHYHDFGGVHGAPAKLPTPYLAANALAKVDRKVEARKIAEVIVRVWPGFDAGWKLALDLMGDDFPALAEQVFARDRFEERPLIWLARYQLDRDDIAKAEELIRRAIAIDPSDGEQGRGDRMRAYAVLAEVLRKKQDNQMAAVYEGAVKAIRLAERADEFYVAGLLSRGIQMYLESLTYFADAYCIQSRLAVQLVTQGDLEGAAKHYQRAFELMPDSFGRVESHCFGCEGAFRGDLAETIATRVFTKLVADQPQNPKVHYLIGYLRSSQGRNREAIEAFRQATTLDPDYLNAWKSMISAAEGQSDLLTPEQLEDATFQILRLDPLGQHANADFNHVRDLKRLWTVLHAHDDLTLPQSPEPLFPLSAAAKVRNADVHQQYFHSIAGNHLQDRRNRFQSHPDVAAILNLLQMENQ